MRATPQVAFPSELYAAPKPQFDWLFSLRFRVWPAGFFCDAVELEAVNEAQARIRGAIELGASAEKVRVQRIATGRLEGSARA